MGTSVRDGGIGAVVGVIIGILVGAACVWLYFGKRRRAQTGEDRPVEFVKLEKPQPSTRVILSEQAIYTDYTLHGWDDYNVSKEFGMACRTIELKGRACYHRKALTHIPDSFDEALGRLGLGEAVTSNIKNLLIDPKTRIYTIIHLTARVIWTNLDIHTIGPLSLLPSWVTHFIPTLPFSFEDLDGRNQAPLTAWRQISAYLLQEDKTIPRTLPPPPSIEPQIMRLFKALQDVLEVFAKGLDGPYTQSYYLLSTIRECATVGYHLFTHPTEWQYIWETEPTPDAITIYPGLVKLSNEHGEPYEKPQPLDKFPKIRKPGPIFMMVGNGVIEEREY